MIVGEGNISFVKLRLPVTSGTRWNANTFNALGPDEYVYADIGASAVLGGMTFENTLTVRQEENDDPIVFRDMRSEVFAEGVGLVFKEVIQLNYCTEDACLGQQKVDHGLEMTMTIKAYGD